MTPFVKACKRANIEIRDALSKANPTLFQRYEVGAGGDVSSGADLLAEKIFFRHLSPFGLIESEESGIMGDGESTIIIDPLDGSSNFASRFPYYGTSVAKLDVDATLEVAIVCNLINGDFFIKEAGKERVNTNIFGDMSSDVINEEDSLSKPEIGLFEKAYAYPELVSGLLESGYKFRSPGATALSLAYANSVRFFIFIGKARIYDVAAGLALCEGMEMIIEDEYVIVAKEKSVLIDLKKIISRSLK